MKSLVVYYSRTGNTRKIALEIAVALNADIEEITDTENREGVLGYLKSGMQSSLKKQVEIHKPEKDPSKYDLVVLGTPIWSWKLIPPLRTYINDHKFLKNVAFFCTEQGSGGKGAFKEMESMIGIKPLAKIEIFQKDLKDNVYEKRLTTFIKKLSR
ncbi:flavodoxin family protein [candidate division KSB1 bacterium]